MHYDRCVCLCVFFFLQYILVFDLKICLFVFQIPWGLRVAGELHRPVWLGRVHTSAKRQSESSVPEDRGTSGPHVVRCCTSSDTTCSQQHTVLRRNVRFRCCWGCWRAPRSTSPHRAAAVASIPRNPTTSCPWQAARSGQNPLQHMKKKIKSYTQLLKSMDTLLSSTGLVCCPSACRMCVNPNCPPECPHIRRWVCLRWCLVLFQSRADKMPHIFLFIVGPTLR